MSGSRHIPAAVRAAVLKRDGYACKRCSSTDDLHVDHIEAYAHGGPATEDNLQTLCGRCNRSKGSRSAWAPWTSWGGWLRMRSIPGFRPRKRKRGDQ